MCNLQVNVEVSIDLLPDPRQVMIVVLGNKVQVIDKSHRRLQSWMRDRSGERRGIGLLLELSDAIEQLNPMRAKAEQNLFQRARIVVGLVGPPVLEIGGGKLFGTGNKIIDASKPERLKIDEMTGMLLRGPLAIGLRSDDAVGAIAESLLKARGRSTQACEQIRKKLGRKGELEAAFEPRWRLPHASEMLQATQTTHSMESDQTKQGPRERSPLLMTIRNVSVCLG